VEAIGICLVPEKHFPDKKLGTMGTTRDEFW